MLGEPTAELELAETLFTKILKESQRYKDNAVEMITNPTEQPQRFKVQNGSFYSSLPL